MSPAHEPDHEPCQERNLLPRIASGEAAALEELSRRYLPLLRAEAGRVLGDVDEAQDIAQEVLWKVWRRAAEYDPARAAVGTWLTVLTRRAAIDRLRARQRHLRLVEAQPRESAAALPEIADAVIVRSRFAPVRRALRTLPREQRQMLEMTYFRDLTQREIAQLTGIPIGTVKSRVSLAIKKLRRSLAAAS